MTSNRNGDLPITDSNGSCACCAPRDAHGAAAESAPETTAASAAFLVSGMTCGHCVASVTEELGSLDGVQAVDVELNAGGASRVTVASAQPLELERVREAVAEAGYDLVQPTP